MYKEVILDLATGEQTAIEFSKTELAKWEKSQQEQLKVLAEIEAEATRKAEARAAAEAKLLELGLTVDDLKALLV
jgi:hypothetical protein